MILWKQRQDAFKKEHEEFLKKVYDYLPTFLTELKESIKDINIKGYYYKNYCDNVFLKNYILLKIIKCDVYRDISSCYYEVPFNKSNVKKIEKAINRYNGWARIEGKKWV